MLTNLQHLEISVYEGQGATAPLPSPSRVEPIQTRRSPLASSGRCRVRLHHDHHMIDVQLHPAPEQQRAAEMRCDEMR